MHAKGVSWSSKMYFFFNDTATTEIYTLSLHDALPIFNVLRGNAAMHDEELRRRRDVTDRREIFYGIERRFLMQRSEEHTSELQSRQYLVCRLLLVKKYKILPVNLLRHYQHDDTLHSLT